MSQHTVHAIEGPMEARDQSGMVTEATAANIARTAEEIAAVYDIAAERGGEIIGSYILPLSVQSHVTRQNAGHVLFLVEKPVNFQH